MRTFDFKSVNLFDLARRRLHDDRGVAAVEFALIAPVMIGLYLSTIVTTQAYMSSRKVALVARALSDVASRQTAATSTCTPTTSGNPCIGNTDIANFFAAAKMIMAPYATTSLKMTLSRVDILTDSSSKLWAYTKWSVTSGGVVRPCSNDGTTPGSAFNNTYVSGSPAAPAPTGSSTLSTKYYPLRPGTQTTTTSGYQGYLSQQYTMAGAPTGYLMVADVIYTYTPGFTFKVFNWSNLTAITTGWTQAFWSRTGLSIDGHLLTNASSPFSTTVNLCSQNDPGQA